MSRSTDHSKSVRRPKFRVLAVLSLVGAAVYFWSAWKDRVDPDSKLPMVALEKRATRLKREAKSFEPPAPSAPVAVSMASVQVQAVHEGHGDECAQCLAERKLADYREDYARMQHTRVLNERDADERQSLEVLDACRVLAAKVLQEWSFSESRPVLPPDEVVDARQREILEPLLARLPLKEGGDR